MGCLEWNYLRLESAMTQTHKPTNPQTHKPTNPHTHTPTHPQTDKPTHPHTHTPANRQTHKPTNPQTHKPTNPQTYTGRPRRTRKGNHATFLNLHILLLLSNCSYRLTFLPLTSSHPSSALQSLIGEKLSKHIAKTESPRECSVKWTSDRPRLIASNTSAHRRPERRQQRS